MYDFVDRPITGLNNGGRFLVWSMRAWIGAVEAKRCPPAAIGPVFVKWELADALPHFNMAMSILNRHAIEPVYFAPLGCSNIREGEALVLSIFCAMRNDLPVRVRETLSLMIDEIALTPLFTALTAVAFRLAEASLIPEAPLNEGLSAGNSGR